MCVQEIKNSDFIFGFEFINFYKLDWWWKGFFSQEIEKNILHADFSAFCM